MPDDDLTFDDEKLPNPFGVLRHVGFCPEKKCEVVRVFIAGPPGGALDAHRAVDLAIHILACARPLAKDEAAAFDEIVGRMIVRACEESREHAEAAELERATVTADRIEREANEALEKDPR